MNTFQSMFKRPSLMAPVLICLIGTATVGISIATLFKVGMEEEKSRLTQMVLSQARLFEAVAQFDVLYSTNDHLDGAFGATMEKIVSAHKTLNGFGETGEFVIGKLIDGQINILQKPRFEGEVNFQLPEFVPIPMERALIGESGEIIAPDYKGHQVLASYEPVSILDIGLVAKIDTAEINRPYIISAIVAAILSSAMLVIGIFAARYFVTPFAEKEVALKKLSKSQKELAKAQELAGLGSWSWNISDNSEEWSDEQFRIFGYQPGEVEPTQDLFLNALHPQDRQKVTEQVQNSLENDVLYDTEFRIIDAKGVLRHIRAIGEVQRDNTGQPVSMIGTVLDITERKRVENDLRFNEQRFRDITESSSDWFWETDVDHRFTYVSERGPEAIGSNTKDILGKSRWDLVSKNINEEKWKTHRDDLENHKMFRELEYSIITSTNEEIIISVSGIPVFDGEGEFHGYRGTARDVTIRRASELLLKKSEERFTKSQNFANIGTWDWNIQSGELYWSERIGPLFGYEPGQLETTYDNFVTAIHPEDREMVTGAVMACIEKGEEYNIEHRVVWPNGTVRILLEKGDVVRDENDQPLNMLGVVQDITESKNAEQQIQRLSRRNELILNAAGDGIYGVDLDGLCTFANPAVTAMLGYEVDELIGVNQHDLLHHTRPNGTYYPRTECPIYAAFKGGKVHLVDDEVFWHKDGSEIPVEYTSTPIFEENETVGAVVVFRDISERTELQAQLIQSSKMATLGEMATGVAHELNQPLNVIRMVSHNIQHKFEKDRLDADYLIDKLAKIDGQVLRASTIIDHMRIFGRKPDAVPTPFNLKHMVESALTLIGEQLRLANIEVTTEAPELHHSVLGHQVQIEQVLLNLIGNARDVLQDKQDGDKRISITVEEDNGKATIAIEDTGGGVADDALPRVFEPFFTTKEVGKGTGLGLSISYGIVKEMGGEITVTNTNEGARFVISLPTCEDVSEVA